MVIPSIEAIKTIPEKFGQMWPIVVSCGQNVVKCNLLFCRILPNFDHILYAYMKKCLFALAALSLLFACTPENNNNGGGGQNNQDELTVTGEVLEITDYSATLTGYANLPLELGDAEMGIMYDKVKTFEAAKKVVATGLDGNNKFTVTATGLEPSTTYYFKSYVQNGMAVKYGAVKSFTTKESSTPEGAVDLGIMITRTDGTTYKLYWAKSNLSDKGLCTNQEDYGDYYAWGETKPKENYSWLMYKFGKSSSGPFSKYSTPSSDGPIDNKTVLEPEDDVAHVKLGGKWRMPTDFEWTELRAKCTWTWVTNYNGSGIEGILVKATNGNSIFLPAAGYRNSSDLRGAGSSGCYWSSFLCANYPGVAYVISFSSDHTSSGSDRYLGRSVRPVSEL